MLHLLVADCRCRVPTTAATTAAATSGLGGYFIFSRFRSSSCSCANRIDNLGSTNGIDHLANLTLS